jgi:hypothetical protein
VPVRHAVRQSVGLEDDGVRAPAIAGIPLRRRGSIGRRGACLDAVVALVTLTVLAAPAAAQPGPATPNPMCPHLDTWNPRGIKGPNGVDHRIVRYPAGVASQRGGTCSVLVDASYERDRERSYSFLEAGQFLVNERFGRSPDRDSAVSGTRAFFLFPRPRRLILEPEAEAGHVTIRLDPVRVVQVDPRGLISYMTGAVIEEAPVVTAMTRGGVTFKRFDGVLLDAGWGRGDVAFRKFPAAESTFTDDRAGRECGVPNRAIFSYGDPRHPTLAFGSDLELSRFLTARCGPTFDVAPLLAGPRRADPSVFEPLTRVPPPPTRPRPRP